MPQPFDRIEFRGVRRQGQKRDVLGNRQSLGSMPAGIVQHQHHMTCCPNVLADRVEVQLHHVRVGPRKNQRTRIPRHRIHRTIQINPLIFVLQRNNRSATLGSPDVAEASLLSEPRFILQPDLYLSVGVLFLDGLDKKGAPSFQAASSSGFFLGFTGRGLSGSSPKRCNSNTAPRSEYVTPNSSANNA